MDVNEASFQVIADLLAQHTGQQLTHGRRWRVPSALSGVFREHGIDNLEQLTCLLDNDKDGSLAREVVEALINNETYFFRDKPTFDQLPEEILPLLADRRRDKRTLNVWSAGCSSGQEPHSLAMEFAENPARWSSWTINILGTDISSKAIAAARTGRYSQFDVQRGLSVVQMLKHFEETREGWQLNANLKRQVNFQKHNILERPPLQQRFDLILCRNVLLYFDPATRERAFARLFDALAPDGFLMLGAGESVVGRTTLFRPSGSRPSIFEAAKAPRMRQLAG